MNFSKMKTHKEDLDEKKKSSIAYGNVISSQPKDNTYFTNFILNLYQNDAINQDNYPDEYKNNLNINENEAKVTIFIIKLI